MWKGYRLKRRDKDNLDNSEEETKKKRGKSEKRARK